MSKIHHLYLSRDDCPIPIKMMTFPIPHSRGPIHGRQLQALQVAPGRG